LNNIILTKKQLDADMEAEMDVIVKKYSELTRPIIDKSLDIITGRTLPTEG